VDAEAITTTETAVRRRIPASILRHAPIYTSPLSRCATLASALAESRTAVVADELIEMDFGSWEGMPWESVPRDELNGWAQNIWSYRPGGGENAKTLAARWQRWRDRVSRMHRSAVVAVTHAGIIRVALERAGRLALSDMVLAPIEFGSVHCIDVSDSLSAFPQEVEVPA
jgi:alpha-ribazole phosphatase